MKTALRLTLSVLAAYGAYVLWKRFTARDTNVELDGDSSARRVQERAELTVEEWAVGSDDPVAQAKAILAESDERADLPRTAEGIERRRSEDTVEP